MIGSAIREIAAAQTSPLICAAFNERIVQIWDVGTQQKVNEFSASFSFGARTLAMHPDGRGVVTGVSTARNGCIVSYGVPNFDSMWRRDRLPYPAYIRFGRSGLDLYCTFQQRKVERMNALTGATIEVLGGITEYFEGSNERALVSPVSAPDYFLHADHKILIPKLTFGILDVAFGSDSLCITESSGPVRCLNDATGVERWRYSPPDGSHVLRLYHNRQDASFYGILWHYEKGHFRDLIRLDPNTGQASHVRKLKSSAEAFVEMRQQLVTSHGEIIGLSNGEVVGQLAFPRKEYPDKVALI